MEERKHILHTYEYQSWYDRENFLSLFWALHAYIHNKDICWQTEAHIKKQKRKRIKQVGIFSCSVKRKKAQYIEIKRVRWNFNCDRAFPWEISDF